MVCFAPAVGLDSFSTDVSISLWLEWRLSVSGVQVMEGAYRAYKNVTLKSRQSALVVRGVSSIKGRARRAERRVQTGTYDSARFV